MRHGSHACWSHAEAFLLDFLVSLSRNVGVMRSTSVAALHLVSFSSHHIHLHVRSVCSHAASLFPYFSGFFVLLAVVWRTRATGRLSEVLGFVVYNCWPCPLSSWFLRNIWFPELVEVAASLFLAPFPFLVGNDVCSATCYLVCICF